MLNHPQQPSEESIRKALLAIDRITADQSELAELWDGGGVEWRAKMADLYARVASRVA